MNDDRVLRRHFEPIAIGTMIVKNRMVVPAMGTGFATPDGLVTQQMLEYYEARAQGGAGMVVVENACVDFPRRGLRWHRSARSARLPARGELPAAPEQARGWLGLAR